MHIFNTKWIPMTEEEKALKRFEMNFDNIIKLPICVNCQRAVLDKCTFFDLDLTRPYIMEKKEKGECAGFSKIRQ